MSSPGVASALTLSEAAVARPGFNIGNVDGRSYDGAGFNTFNMFSSFTDGVAREFSTFNGGAQGMRLEFTLLSEVAAFDGTIPGLSNQFGFIAQNGNFISVLDTATANPGSTAVYNQGANEELTLALKSPEGLFSSIDANNVDNGAAHILGQVATSSGLLTISPNSLHGGITTFNVQTGDFFISIEDLLQSGNFDFGALIPATSDADFNDMVLVVRATPIPEPATMALLGSGLAAAAVRRRKRTA